MGGAPIVSALVSCQIELQLETLCYYVLLFVFNWYLNDVKGDTP